MFYYFYNNIYSYFYNKDIIRKNIVYFNYNEQYIWGIKGVKLYKIITALFFLILGITISYAQVSDSQTISVYLSVPEFIKITNLSKDQMSFEINLSEDNLVFGDNLVFDVYANINYLLVLEFKFKNDLSEDIKMLVEETYGFYITDLMNQIIVNAKENLFAERNKGIERYKLIFEMDMSEYGGSNLPQFDGQIGNIEIIVSKIETL